MSTVKYFKWKELLQAQNSLGMAPRGWVRGAEWSLLGQTKSSPEDKEKGPFTWPFFLASSDMGIPALTGGLGS